MQFLSQGEKLKMYRRIFGVNQKELEQAGVTRAYISMCEIETRRVSKDLSGKIVHIFKEKAEQIGQEFNVDDNYFATTPKQDAETYCKNRLKEEELENNDFIEIVHVARQYEIKEILPEIYLKKAELLFVAKDYVQGFNCFFDALEVLLSLNVRDKIPFIYNRLGYCKGELLNYTEAINYFIKANELAISLENKDIEIMSLYNIAYEYYLMKDFGNAFIYLDKFFSLFNINDNRDMYLMASIVKGNCYTETEKLNEAMEVYNNTLNLINNPSNSLNCFIYDNLAEVHYKKGNVDIAFGYYTRVQKFREKYDKEKLQKTFINKAILYVKEEMYEEAQELLKRGIDLAIRNKDKEYIMKGYGLLEKIYVQNEDKENLEDVYNKMLSFLNYIDKEEGMKIYMKLSLLKSADEWKECISKTIEL